MENAQTSWRNS